jgi:hypothetical protein
MTIVMPIEQAGKSRPLPYNYLKIARNGCKNLTPRPTEERCRASSNRNSCYAIAHNFFNGNYTKACLPSCIFKSGGSRTGRRVVFPHRNFPKVPAQFRNNFRDAKTFWTAMGKSCSIPFMFQ